MATRVRFDIVWTLNRDTDPGEWHSFDDHLALLQRVLVERFACYKAAMSSHLRDITWVRSEIRITWDIDLASEPGAWYDPEDHLRMLDRYLVHAFDGYRAGMSVEIWREVDIPGVLNDKSGAARRDPPRYAPWDQESRTKLFLSKVAA